MLCMWWNFTMKFYLEFYENAISNTFYALKFKPFFLEKYLPNQTKSSTLVRFFR